MCARAIVCCSHVCSFPGTVHGGLTSAILDESFGGLMVNLWRVGWLGVWPPPYTVRLIVDFKTVRACGGSQGGGSEYRTRVGACVRGQPGGRVRVIGPVSMRACGGSQGGGSG